MTLSLPRWFRGRIATVAAVLFLALTFAVQLTLSVRGQSQTWDEAYHLLAGYRYWQAADFGINPEHPPLVKMLAALPLLFLRPPVPHIPQGTSKQEGFVAARKFLYTNDADTLLLGARLAVGLLVMLLAFLVFEATYRLFGLGPALLALAVLVFDPNLLAHGALITTDAALACAVFAAVWAFYRYVTKPSTLALLACGVVAGIALAVKHSGVLILPTLALLGLAELFVAWRLQGEKADTAPALRGLARSAFSMGAVLLVITAIAVVTLWGSYRFRFQARRDNLRMTPPLTEYIRGVNTPGLKSPTLTRLILGLERWHVLPQSYLYGLTDVLIVSAGPRPAYLFGRLYSRGRWFYFPAVFVIKSTLGFLLLLGVAVVGRSFFRRERLREILFLTLPPAFYFAISLTSKLNVGVRHLLPIYPFLIVLVAAAVWDLIRQRRRWAYMAAALVGLHALSSLRTFPHYLAYSNELWGGHQQTYRVLTDSNADWGQELITIKRYLDRKRIHDCWLAYFGSADPGYYGIPCKLLPDVFAVWWDKPVDVVPEVYEGTVLVGATQMAAVYWGPDDLNLYGQFLSMRPVENVGGSTLVFKGRFDLKKASAWSRLNRAWELALSDRLDQAMAEARSVTASTPRLVFGHYTLGYFLAEKKQMEEARQEYETALQLARTIHPEYQWYWVPFLEKRLSEW